MSRRGFPLIVGAFAVHALDREAFARLASGLPPAAGMALPARPLAPPEVLAMLAGLCEGLRGEVDPNAWVALEEGTLVALCTVTRMAAPGVHMVGYGTAPGHEGKGAAGAVLNGPMALARRCPGIAAIAAETSVDNPASQRVLARAGFVQVGTREDPEDGSLLCWRRDTV